jgi:transcriptional regulator with XRE-family HTH domain
LILFYQTFRNFNKPENSMENMSIARFARKERLPHGAQSEIARKLGVADSVVSRVMNDKAADLNPRTVRRIRVAIARKLNMRVDEVFPAAA